MTETQWHCYFDRTQDGPLAESILARRFGERLVPLHALVWAETWTQDEWRPAREMDAFRRAATGPRLAPPVAVPVPPPAVMVPVVRAPAPAAPRARPVLPPGAAWKPVPRAPVPSVGRTPLRPMPPRAIPPPQVILPAPGPWARFWARAVDLGVGGNLLLTLLILPWVYGLPREGYLMQTVLGSLSWMIVETLMLAMFGTTPGKWLFDIQVQTPGGDLPRYWVAVRRCAAVFVWGLGVGIPLLGFPAMIASYNRLMAEGQTAWDRATGLTVVQRGSGWLGWSVLATTLAVGSWMLLDKWQP